MSAAPDSNTLLQRINSHLHSERDADWLDSLGTLRDEIAAERKKAEEFIEALDLAEFDLDEAEYDAEQKPEDDDEHA